jgi:hypothetical protein
LLALLVDQPFLFSRYATVPSFLYLHLPHTLLPAMGRGIFAGKAAFSQATPRLMVFCAIYALGSIFFGYDGASFGGVQAMDPFLRTFGHWDEVKEAYVLSRELQSLMNSIPLIGKFLGTVIVGPIIERVGHRWAMAFTCGVQVVGPISQSNHFSRLQYWPASTDSASQSKSRVMHQHSSSSAASWSIPLSVSWRMCVLQTQPSLLSFFCLD